MRTAFFILMFTIVIASCSRLNEDELLQGAQAAYEQKNFQEALDKLHELVERFPKGTHAETAQFLTAKIYNDELHDYQKAISAYRTYRRLFPDSARASTALFLIGFIYNNELRQYDSAKATYEQFLALYPNHEMAPSTKFELETPGRNPEK